MEKQYKILVLVMPVYGHLYPMTSVINDLAKNKNLSIFFPGNEEDRLLIERTGARFVPMHVELIYKNLNMNQLNNDFPMDQMINQFIDISTDILPKLVDLIEREKFDLIIYDFAATYGRWLKYHLQMLERTGKLRCKIPPFMMFSPSFMSAKDVYPNKAEPSMFPTPKLGLTVIFKLILLAFRYVFFFWKFGLKFENPMNLVYYREELNICGIVPELQPRSHLFEKSTVFVGSCASEELRESKQLEEPLKSFLAPFEPTNPVPLVDMRADNQFLAKRKIKLIFVSFGTLFNEEVKPYLDIIDAFNSLEQTEASHFKLLISTGEKSYAKFQKMIQKGELKEQDNILFMKKVPQLDVLKRASLFFTHSGQGSTNEAIHYGVPMICIPVFGDQPSVAYRCADELGLGIRLVYEELTANKVKDALNTILTERSYLDRVSLFSQISRKYDGPKNFSNQVIKYLQKIYS